MREGLHNIVAPVFYNSGKLVTFLGWVWLSYVKYFDVGVFTLILFIENGQFNWLKRIVYRLYNILSDNELLIDSK